MLTLVFAKYFTSCNTNFGLNSAVVATSLLLLWKKWINFFALNLVIRSGLYVYLAMSQDFGLLLFLPLTYINNKSPWSCFGCMPPYKYYTWLWPMAAILKYISFLQINVYHWNNPTEIVLSTYSLFLFVFAISKNIPNVFQ
jgi:hypothetical protein